MTNTSAELTYCGVNVSITPILSEVGNTTIYAIGIHRRGTTYGFFVHENKKTPDVVTILDELLDQEDKSLSDFVVECYPSGDAVGSGRPRVEYTKAVMREAFTPEDLKALRAAVYKDLKEGKN